MGRRRVVLVGRDPGARVGLAVRRRLGGLNRAQAGKVPVHVGCRVGRIERRVRPRVWDHRRVLDDDAIRLDGRLRRELVGDVVGVVDGVPIHERVELRERGRHHELRRRECRVPAADLLRMICRSTVREKLSDRVLDEQVDHRRGANSPVAVRHDLVEIGLGDLRLLEGELEEPAACCSCIAASASRWSISATNAACLLGWSGAFATESTSICVGERPVRMFFTLAT